jgi:hypothetical protein
MITVLLFALMVAGMRSAGAAAAPPTIKLGAAIALIGGMASGGKDVKADYGIAIKHSSVCTLRHVEGGRR